MSLLRRSCLPPVANSFVDPPVACLAECIHRRHVARRRLDIVVDVGGGQSWRKAKLLDSGIKDLNDSLGVLFSLSSGSFKNGF